MDRPTKIRMRHMTVEQLDDIINYATYKASSKWLPAIEKARWRTTLEYAERVKEGRRVGHG